MQPETNFKAKVQKRLRLIPDLYTIKIQQMSLRGHPDIIMCFRGKFVAWELKVPPNKVKPGSLQAFNLASIQRAGGVAIEVTPENFEERLKELLCL